MIYYIIIILCHTHFSVGELNYFFNFFRSSNAIVGQIFFHQDFFSFSMYSLNIYLWEWTKYVMLILAVHFLLAEKKFDITLQLKILQPTGSCYYKRLRIDSIYTITLLRILSIRPFYVQNYSPRRVYYLNILFVFVRNRMRSSGTIIRWPDRLDVWWKTNDYRHWRYLIDASRDRKIQSFRRYLQKKKSTVSS